MPIRVQVADSTLYQGRLPMDDIAAFLRERNAYPNGAHVSPRAILERFVEVIYDACKSRDEDIGQPIIKFMYSSVQAWQAWGWCRQGRILVRFHGPPLESLIRILAHELRHNAQDNRCLRAGEDCTCERCRLLYQPKRPYLEREDEIDARAFADIIVSECLPQGFRESESYLAALVVPELF